MSSPWCFPNWALICHCLIMWSVTMRSFYKDVTQILCVNCQMFRHSQWTEGIMVKLDKCCARNQQPYVVLHYILCIFYYHWSQDWSTVNINTVRRRLHCFYALSKKLHAFLWNLIFIRNQAFEWMSNECKTKVRIVWWYVLRKRLPMP